MSALRATVDLGQLIRSAPLRDLTWPQNRVRLLPTKEESRRAVRLHRSGPPDSRTLSPGDPIFFHHTAMLLDKTARSVGGWSTRRIVDRHHRMTLDGKGRRQ